MRKSWTLLELAGECKFLPAVGQQWKKRTNDASKRNHKLGREGSITELVSGIERPRSGCMIGSDASELERVKFQSASLRQIYNLNLNEKLVSSNCCASNNHWRPNERTVGWSSRECDCRRRMKSNCNPCIAPEQMKRESFSGNGAPKEPLPGEKAGRSIRKQCLGFINGKHPSPRPPATATRKRPDNAKQKPQLKLPQLFGPLKASTRSTSFQQSSPCSHGQHLPTLPPRPGYSNQMIAFTLVQLILIYIIVTSSLIAPIVSTNYWPPRKHLQPQASSPLSNQAQAKHQEQRQQQQDTPLEAQRSRQLMIGQHYNNFSSIIPYSIVQDSDYGSMQEDQLMEPDEHDRQRSYEGGEVDGRDTRSDNNQEMINSRALLHLDSSRLVLPQMQQIKSRFNQGCVGGTKCQFFAFCWMSGGSLGASCGLLMTCCVTPSRQEIQPGFYGPVVNDPCKLA